MCRGDWLTEYWFLNTLSNTNFNWCSPFNTNEEFHVNLWEENSPSNNKQGIYNLILGEGSGTPLQYSCLENSMDGGAWWAAVHGVAKSRTRLSDFPFTFHFHALEKEMATHSSVLAWRIPGTGEPGGLPSMGSPRVGHDWSDLAAYAYKHIHSLSHTYTCLCVCLSQSLA